MVIIVPIESPLTPSLSPLTKGGEGAASGRIQTQQLQDACQQFEAVFLLQLWRAMQRTVPQARQTLNYAEMFDLTFAEYLARYGQFGIAEKLYEQLTRGIEGETDARGATVAKPLG